MNLSMHKYGRETNEPSVKRLGSGPRATNIRITQNSSTREIDSVIRRQVSRESNSHQETAQAQK